MSKNLFQTVRTFQRIRDVFVMCLYNVHGTSFHLRQQGPAVLRMPHHLPCRGGSFTHVLNWFVVVFFLSVSPALKQNARRKKPHTFTMAVSLKLYQERTRRLRLHQQSTFCQHIHASYTQYKNSSLTPTFL